MTEFRKTNERTFGQIKFKVYRNGIRKVDG